MTTQLVSPTATALIILHLLTVPRSRAPTERRHPDAPGTSSLVRWCAAFVSLVMRTFKPARYLELLIPLTSTVPDNIFSKRLQYGSFSLMLAPLLII